MRQRTMAPTPQEYDPQEEESLGIPTTIEVPADALSVDPEPRIPLKIEVSKVRAPKNNKTNKSKGSNSRRRTAAQYDDYLYGSGTAPPVELKQWTAAEAAPTATSTASTTTAASSSTSVLREGKDLVAIGSFLANGARQASQRAERQALLLPQLPVDKKKPPTTRGKNTGTGTRRDSFTRSSSVPSVMQGVNAREAVDFFQDPKRPSPKQPSVQAQAPREIEIGLDLPGTAPAASPPSPTIPATRRRPPQRHPSLAGQSSMSMIFQVAPASTSNASTGPPKKQLSNRSMQTTSTHTVLTTSSHPHMSASSNSCTSTTPHPLQDYSAHVGYVMEDSSSRLVDLPPTKPPRYNKTFQVPKEWEYHPLPPTNSTTTATTAWMEGEDDEAPPFSQQHNKPSSNKGKNSNSNKKWKNLFPRKSMTSLTRR